MNGKSPLRLFQIGLGLLIIFGSPDAVQFFKAYAVDSFHYTLLPAALVPSASGLDVIFRLRVVLAVLVLLNVWVSPAFTLLGFSGLFTLLAVPTSFHHNVYLLHLLCLWAALCGRCSVDDRDEAGWPSRVFLLQLSAIYGFSAMHKVLSPDWVSGRVLYLFAQSGVFHFLTAVLTPLTTAIFAPGSIVLELFLSAAFWFPRWRVWAVMGGILFHTTLEAITPVGYFSWEMLLMYLAAVGHEEPALVRPLWMCSLAGIVLLGLRDVFPAMEIARALSLPLGAATVFAIARSPKNSLFSQEL